MALPALAAFVANPVVVRDLRAQMRGTKSYWYMGAYLLLVGALAVCGYAYSTRQGFWQSAGGTAASAPQISIIDAQAQLQTFYYFLFVTLATLIALIAPALTASSVVGERQRQSLDLLVTTPLTAMQLLIGKLISSVAFLGLLLALSLPATALCVLLGGATLGDVFRIYLLLTVDGLVLSAIGLYFSCAARTSLLAIVWSYVAVVAFLAGTYYAAVVGGDIATSSYRAINTPPLLAIGLLNPIAAIAPRWGRLINLGDLAFPGWLGALVAAALVLRLLVTASAYRLGVYGGGTAPSLRRQALLLAGLGMFLTIDGLLSGGDRPSGPAARTALELMTTFLALSPFLPGLFVPVGPEDAPPGVVEANGAVGADGGWFRLRRAFQPVHSGALPYYLLLTLALLTGALAGYRVAIGSLSSDAVATVSCAALLFLGLGILLWSLSRLAAALAAGAGQARALAFGMAVLLLVLPMPLVFTTEGSARWTESPVVLIWPLVPLFRSNSREEILNWTPVCALEACVLALAFVLLREALLAWRTRRCSAPMRVE